MNITQLFDSLLKNHEIEAFQKEYYERRKMNHINYISNYGRRKENASQMVVKPRIIVMCDPM